MDGSCILVGMGKRYFDVYEENEFVRTSTLARAFFHPSFAFSRLGQVWVLMDYMARSNALILVSLMYEF